MSLVSLKISTPKSSVSTYTQVSWVIIVVLLEIRHFACPWVFYLSGGTNEIVTSVEIMYVHSLYYYCTTSGMICYDNTSIHPCFPWTCNLFWPQNFHPGNFFLICRICGFLTICYFSKLFHIIMVLKIQKKKYIF